MDELLLSKRKRLLRDSLYFAFGGIALIFFVIYFCLLTLKSVTVTIGDGKVVWDYVRNVQIVTGGYWKQYPGMQASYSIMDLIIAPFSFPLGDTGLFFKINNWHVVTAAFWITIPAVICLVASYIAGIVGYFTRKKLSWLVVGLSLLSAIVTCFAAGYWMFGYTSLVLTPVRTLIQTKPMSGFTYDATFSFCLGMLLLSVLFSVLWSAYTPYILDSRSSALAAMKGNKIRALHN